MAKQVGSIRWFYWMAYHTAAGGYGHSYGTLMMVPGQTTEEQLFVEALERIQARHPGVGIAVIGYRAGPNEIRE
jgi:hypothetical protein